MGRRARGRDAATAMVWRAPHGVYVVGVVVLLVATLAAALASHQLVERQQRDRFDAQVDRLARALEERVTTYVQVLRGGVGLFGAAQEVTRVEWDDYVAALRLDDRYPGFKSLSYAEAVPEEGLDALVRRVRAERVPRSFGTDEPLRRYALRAPAGSDGDTTVHAPILYVAPWVSENHAVLGVDMMLEERRRAAMRRAALTGEARTTPGLVLSGSADREAGFIVYLPVLDGERLQGWLTAAFLAQRFIDGVEEARATDLDLEVRDGTLPDATLLFSSAGTAEDGSPLPLPDRPGVGRSTARVPDDLSEDRTIPVPGGTWQAHFQAPGDFARPGEVALPWLVLGAGLATCLVLVGMVRGARRWRTVAAVLEAQSQGLHEARRAAEEAVAVRSRFLATMSHEIRTPLTAIQASVEAMRHDPLHGDQARYADIIGRSSGHLLQVVNNLLDWSRIEADEVVLHLRPVDVERVVEGVLLLVSPVAEVAGVDLVADVGPGLRVRGDDARLRQVLLNLVANAVRFTPRGGEVRVVGLLEDEDRLRLEVHDTGPGIVPEDLERIFAPYAQAGPDGVSRRAGTGLGLAICQRLVTAMGGRITARSSPGEGATFEVVLPAATRRPQDGTPAPAGGAALVVSPRSNIL